MMTKQSRFKPRISLRNTKDTKVESRKSGLFDFLLINFQHENNSTNTQIGKINLNKEQGISEQEKVKGPSGQGCANFGLDQKSDRTKPNQIEIQYFGPNFGLRFGFRFLIMIFIYFGLVLVFTSKKPNLTEIIVILI